jgi:hypothetical protein
MFDQTFICVKFDQSFDCIMINHTNFALGSIDLDYHNQSDY